MRLVFLSLFSLFWSSLALAAPIQWGANGHYYEFVNSGLTYHEASAAAAASEHMGITGHLVTITSDAERMFLDTLNPQGQDVWLAASDREIEGVWKWIEGPEAGSVFYTVLGGAEGYEDWYWNEPNDWRTGEDYAEGWWRGKSWNDVHAGHRNRYIVEYSASPVPLSASLPLLLTGFGGLALLRRRKARG
jgi:hypothetical protein